MRIQLIVDSYFPATTSSAKLMHDLASELQLQGHSVCVAVPDPDLKRSSAVDREDGFDVLRVRSGKRKGASHALRAINEARLSSLMWSHGRSYFESHPADLIAFYSPTIFFGGLVRRLKQRWQCPSYLILRDIFPQWAVDAGVMKQGLAWRFFRWVEDRQYAAADVIGVQSPANLDYFRERGWDQKYRLEVLHNWMQVGDVPPATGEIRQAWGLDDCVVFFYGGNIGIAQDVDNLVRLAENLRDTPQARVVLVGEGSEVPRLKAEIERRGLTNMLVKPSVGQDEYFRLLAEFDVGLISLAKTLQTQNVPGKLLGYLHHGMPVLASINPGNDLQQLIEDRQAGFVSINGDDALFAQQARQLIADAALRKSMGRHGRRLLEDVFSVQQTVRQLLATVPQTAVAPQPQRRAA